MDHDEYEGHSAGGQDAQGGASADDNAGWGLAPLPQGLNGHGTPRSRIPGDDGDELDETASEATPAGGRWVSHGGVLQWEEPEEVAGGGGDERDVRSEATSPWAADEVELPPGAPTRLRVRAVRAWLLGQRERENEALGMLLLERRRLQPEEDASAPVRRRTPVEESPLELAMAEHQAAAGEYEQLVELLADLETHNGPERLLVEFYLALTERLAELANAPEAPADFAPALRTAPPAPSASSPHAASEWQGRTAAVLQARRRVERVTAPETEE